jgi:hypothetical protein
LSGNQSKFTTLTSIASKLSKEIPNDIHADFDNSTLILLYDRARQLQTCLTKLQQVVPEPITIDTSVVDKLQVLIMRRDLLVSKSTELTTTDERIAKGQGILATELTVLSQWMVCPLCGGDMDRH